MSNTNVKEPQATKDLEPRDERRDYNAAWKELRKARMNMPQADRHDTKALLMEYADHMREVDHHRMCAHWVMLDILHNLINDG